MGAVQLLAFVVSSLGAVNGVQEHHARLSHHTRRRVHPTGDAMMMISHLKKKTMLMGGKGEFQMLDSISEQPNNARDLLEKSGSDTDEVQHVDNAGGEQEHARWTNSFFEQNAAAQNVIPSGWSDRIQDEWLESGSQSFTMAELNALADSLSINPLGDPKTNPTLQYSGSTGLHVTVSNGEIYYKPVPDNWLVRARLKQTDDWSWFTLYTAGLLTNLKHLLRYQPLVPNVSFVYEFGDGCRQEISNRKQGVPVFSHNYKKECRPMLTFPGFDWFFPYDHNGFFPGDPDRYDMVPDVAWETKKSVAVFRGGPQSWDCSRDRLIALSAEEQAKGLIDAKLTRCQDDNHFKTCKRSLNCSTMVGSFLTPAEHKHYKYIIDADGNGADLRLKSMMLSGSMAIKVHSGYSEFWLSGLTLGVHYISINETALEKDLPEFVRWARTHDAKCKEIAEAGKTWAQKYLTFDMMHEYQAQVLERYAKAFAEPVPTDGMKRFCCGTLQAMKQGRLSDYCKDSTTCSDDIHPSLNRGGTRHGTRRFVSSPNDRRRYTYDMQE